MPLVDKYDESKGGRLRRLRIIDGEGFDKWYGAASDWLRAWAEDHAFKAQKSERLILPEMNGREGQGGRIAEVLIGTSGEAYVDGAVAAQLPPGTYTLDAACPENRTPENRNLENFALGFALEQYAYDRFKPPAPKPSSKPDLLIDDTALYKRLDALVRGITLTRDLINTPANHLTPQGMEDQARLIASRHGAEIHVTIGEALAQKYPAIHTVGRAAEVPPRLIDIKWTHDGAGGGGAGGGIDDGGAGGGVDDGGADDDTPRITLIGKGVTFDSGGLDLKPSQAMEMMKKDMGGAAHVLGLADIIMSLGLKLRLRVLIPTAENAVSSRSMRPLDVIDTAAGIAVEVGNTDAEGRLILADALHLATADDTSAADTRADDTNLIIDFATLTGAARIALGTELPALFANDETLQSDFIKAGLEVADPLWPLPLHAEYDRSLDAGHAALSSTGAAKYGGAITAALFLQRFLQKPPPPKTILWAHIDVMAWNLSHRPGHPKGGEAMGLRAALALIESRLN